MNSRIKKSDALGGSMAMARKVFRFGPSIVTTRTFILNVIELIKQQNKESTPIFILKTLSALWIALFFVCDHYIWLFRVLDEQRRWASLKMRKSRLSAIIGV